MKLAEKMRLWKMLALAAALALALCACGGGDDDSASASLSAPQSASEAPDSSGVSGASASPDASASADASASPDASASADASASPDASALADASAGEESDASSVGGEAASEPEAPSAASTAEIAPGTFYCYNENRYPAQRAPFVELAAGGAMRCYINTGDSMVTAEGSYAQAGAALSLQVDSLDSTELFRGSGEKTLPFTVLDADNLMFGGEALGLVFQGSVFTREGAQPYAGSLPAPPAASAPPRAASAATPAAQDSSAPPPLPESAPEAEDTLAVSVPLEAEPDSGMDEPPVSGAEEDNDPRVPVAFPWLLVGMVGLGSAVAGAALVVLFTRLRAGRRTAAGENGENAPQKELSPKKSAQLEKKRAQLEKKHGKKVAAVAKKKEQRATLAAKKAEKANRMAEKAAAEAAKAAEVMNGAGDTSKAVQSDEAEERPKKKGLFTRLGRKAKAKPAEAAGGGDAEGEGAEGEDAPPEETEKPRKAKRAKKEKATKEKKPGPFARRGKKAGDADAEPQPEEL